MIFCMGGLDLHHQYDNQVLGGAKPWHPCLPLERRLGSPRENSRAAAGKSDLISETDTERKNGGQLTRLRIAMI